MMSLPNILTFLRITGYGPEYNVQLDCPSCNVEVRHEFDLSSLNMRFLDTEPTERGQNRFYFQLPSGNEITFKFLNTQEEGEISDQLEKLKKM